MQIAFLRGAAEGHHKRINLLEEQVAALEARVSLADNHLARLIQMQTELIGKLQNPFNLDNPDHAPTASRESGS